MFELHLALENRADIETIRKLIEAFPDSVGEVYNNYLPLHIAILAKSSLEIIKLLVFHYQESECRKGADGCYALHFAIMIRPRIDLVMYLTEIFPDALLSKSAQGKLPLHYALEKQVTDDIISYICNKRLETIGIIALTGNYPLHIALAYHYSYEIISLLVNYGPKIVEYKDSNDVLPLRKAIKDRFDEDTVLLFLYVYPFACQEVDEYDRYAIHYAASRNYSEGIISALINTFPSAIRLCDTSGQLPLHIAMVHQDNYDVIQSLIHYYPEATMICDDKGYLPLHYGIENMYDTEILRALIQAGKESAQYVCKGRLALHMCIEFKHNYRTIQLIVEAFPDAIFVKYMGMQHNQKYYELLPIHLALERQLDENIILLLLNTYCNDEDASGCAVATDRVGYFPIHYAVKYHASLNIIKRLLHMYPGIVELKYEVTNNKLLIHYAAEVDATPYAVAEILARTMPFDPVLGKPNPKHYYTWTFVLSDTMDKYFDRIDIILQKYRYETVKLLNDFPDEEGRRAVDIATPRCKHELLTRLYYYDRYELFQESYVHKSMGCVVRLAWDHMASQSTATSVGMPNKQPPQLVALKFMKFSHEFNRELSVRSEIRFDDVYVIGLLCCYDGDADSEYRKETIRKGYEEYPYCIVMLAAQKSLKTIIQSEYIACKVCS